MNTFKYIFVIIFTSALSTTINENNLEIHDKLLELFNVNSTFTLGMSKIIDDLIHFHYEEKCVTLVKDNGADYDVHIGRFKNLMLTTIYLNDTDDDMHNLLTNYENGCDWYIVQTKDPEWFVRAIISVLKFSSHRENPRMTFFPDFFHIKSDEFAQKIFNLTVNVFPDVLVICSEISDSGLILHFKTGDWLTGQSLTLYSCHLEECNIAETEFFPDKMSNLNGKILHCAAFHYPPYVFLKPKLDGTEYRLYEEFSRIHNCTLIVETEDGMWGEIWGNGTGIGVLGRVYREDADFGFGALYLWYHEYQYLDFSIAYSRTGVTCLVPRVQQVSSWLLPLLPFDATLWTLVLTTLAVATITLYYTAKVAYLFSNNWKMRFRTMSDSVLRVIGLIVLQTPAAKGTSPPPLPLRYIITLLEVMFILIVTSYHSGLATTLTLHRYEKPIETIQDLVDSGLPWGNSHDAWIFSIRLTQEKNTKILLQRFQKNNDNFLKNHVKKRNFAFAVERLQSGFFAVGDFVTSESVSSVQLMKEDIYYEFVVGIMPKASPYSKNLNNLIGQIQNAGLQMFWEREMARHYLSLEVQYGIAHSNVIDKDLEPTRLQMKQIFGNLIILAVGYSLALITFIVEILWYKRKNKIRDFIRP